MKTNIASTVSFALFVVIGLLIAVGGKFLPAVPRRRMINLFLCVVLGVSFGAGLTRHNLWPFSSWPVLAYVPSSNNDAPLPRIVGVDGNGREYDIDYRAWQPLALEELTSWIRLHFKNLDPAAQDQVGAYLLHQANRAREQALSSEGLPYPNRWFGPLTAPTHLLHPAIWSHEENIPRGPFVSLRIYEETWDLEERRRDPRKETLALLFEYGQR